MKPGAGLAAVPECPRVGAVPMQATPDGGGKELDLFRHAGNWKRYWARRVLPFVGRSVIEVGAGYGINVPFLWSQQDWWLSVEPDPALAERLRARVASGEAPARCRVIHGTLADVPADVRADTVLYIDVLEHIQGDGAEFARAASHLRDGGHLVVLAPAHRFLFSPFDAEIGHFRRYDRAAFSRLRCADLEPVRIEYLDSVGLLASMANRVLLRSRMPTLTQIRIWDRLLVRASVVVDPLLGRRLGKSILGVWRRRPGRESYAPSGREPA